MVRIIFCRCSFNLVSSFSVLSGVCMYVCLAYLPIAMRGVSQLGYSRCDVICRLMFSHSVYLSVSHLHAVLALPVVLSALALFCSVAVVDMLSLINLFALIV